MNSSWLLLVPYPIIGAEMTSVVKLTLCQFCFLKVSFFGFVLFFNYFTSVQLQLSSFTPTPAITTSLPCFNLPPWFCPCVLYRCSWKLSSPLSPPHSPLVTVRLFLISVSLVIFCLLVCFLWLFRHYNWHVVYFYFLNYSWLILY